MIMKNEKTAVIFRTWKDTGTVIALFPFEPSDNLGYYCNSYERVGQHGAASPSIVHKATRPSKPTEICDLACELRGLGYKLRGLQRFPRNSMNVRRAKLAEMKGGEK